MLGAIAPRKQDWAGATAAEGARGERSRPRHTPTLSPTGGKRALPMKGAKTPRPLGPGQKRAGAPRKDDRNGLQKVARGASSY